MNKISYRRTNLILFLEGFISVSLQIFIMRQLTPFVGNSVVETSIVISFFLSALTLGYYYGGKVSKNHLSVLNRNLMISLAIISYTFSYGFINDFFEFFNSYISNQSLNLSIYLTLFLTPVIFLLAQTIPLLTNFLKNNSVSEVAGTALALNTVGSVLGSVSTSLLLLYYFGMSQTLAIYIVFMFLITILISNKKEFFINSVFFIVIISLYYNERMLEDNDRFVSTNNYGNYAVDDLKLADGRDLRVFNINNSYSSGLYDNKEPFSYIKFIAGYMQMENIIEKDVLVLGSGGFTLSKYYPNNNYLYIDIDNKIKDLAEEFFLKEPINGEFKDYDARVFVKENEKLYDVIVVDLFSSKISIPWHVTTKEFFKDVKNNMKNDGYIFINTIKDRTFNTEYSKTLYNTINSVFDYCYSYPLYNYSNKSTRTNVEYVCRNKNDDKKVFTDNYSDLKN